MAGGYLGKFYQRQSKIELSRDNSEEGKMLESAFFRLSESLKFKILATMEPPPTCTGFITNLPF